MLNSLSYTGPALDVLHEQYAKQGSIDPEAPVQASYQVLIEAPVEVVWGC
jgi:hypothetical protein